MTNTAYDYRVGDVWDCRNGVARLVEVSVRERDFDAAFSIVPNLGWVAHLEFHDYPGTMSELVAYVTNMLGGEATEAEGDAT